MDKRISSKVFGKIYQPDIDSHKGENGRLLIIAGSEKYHGSLIYAVKAASRNVGLIYVLSTEENQGLVKKLKAMTAEFVSVKKTSEAPADAILIGPGMGISPRTYKLVKSVLSSGHKAVLDADAINVLDTKLKKLLNKNNILTPHRGEFQKAFGLAPTRENVRLAAKRYGCFIALKGPEYWIANPGGDISYGKLGNAGAAKGGVGDIIAGLTAAFFCKNAAMDSASAAFFAVDRASGGLYKARKHFYDSEDLCEQLPKTLAKLVR